MDQSLFTQQEKEDAKKYLLISANEIISLSELLKYKISNGERIAEILYCICITCKKADIVADNSLENLGVTFVKKSDVIE